MEIEVNTEKMRNYAGKELEVKGKLEGVCTSLQICQRNLRANISSAASLSVDRALSKTYSNLVELVGKMEQMSGVMVTISGIYENTEDGIEEGKPAKENIEKAKNFDLKLEEGEKKSAAKKAADGLSWVKKLLSAWNHSGESDKLGFFSSFSGMLSSLCNLYDSESQAEWWSNSAKFTGGSLSLGSKLFKVLRPMAEKYGSAEMIESLKGIEKDGAPEVLKNLGIAGDILGLSSSFLDAYYEGSDSIADFLKQCPGVISSGKDLVMDFKKFASAAEKNEYVRKVANPIVAALSMGSYATGEIIKLSSDDHSLTFGEVTNLLTDTGLAGAKSLLSASTFGIVNVDTESFKETLNKNQDAFLDKVMDLNISNQGKTLIVAATSPVIAAGLITYSAGEMVGNFLGNAYQSVKSAWAY